MSQLSKCLTEENVILSFRLTDKIPAIFHNLKEDDLLLIMLEIRKFGANIIVIPNLFFPSIKGSHSVLSFSKPSCFQHLSPSHQLSPYFLSLHLKIFSLVSLFFSFPVTQFLSSFFLHTLCISS